MLYLEARLGVLSGNVVDVMATVRAHVRENLADFRTRKEPLRANDEPVLVVDVCDRRIKAFLD